MHLGLTMDARFAPVPFHAQLLVQCVFRQADVGCRASGLDRLLQQARAHDREALREFSCVTVCEDVAEGDSRVVLVLANSGPRLQAPGPL